MCVLVAIVILITVPAYLLLTQKLSEESDETLYSSAAAIAGQIDAAFASQIPAAPVQSNDPFHYLSGNRGDFFYAVLGVDGTVIINPLGVDLSTFANLPAIRQATDEGIAWRIVSTSGDSYRVLLLAVERPDAPGLIVAVGRSDAEHQRELDLVLLFVAGSGLVGILLALAGGWYLGGRALALARIAFERQKEFVADASHELRTPLAIITTNAEAIARYGAQSLAGADRQALDDIISESGRMSDLVQDLLTLARVDAQDIRPESSEFDLVELAEESIRYFQPQAAAKSLSLRLSAPASIRINSNALAVSRVLRILLENAVQYSLTAAKSRSGAVRTEGG